MITLSKLAIYKRFNGDIDGFARRAIATEEAEISDEDWSSIDRLRNDLFLVQRGLAAPEFCSRVDAELRRLCESEEVVTEVRKLAER